MHGFLRGWAARDEPRRPDDNTAAGHVLCAVAMGRDDPQLRAAAERLGRYLAGRRHIDGVGVTFEDARRSVRAPYGGLTLDAEGQGSSPTRAPESTWIASTSTRPSSRIWGV
ncbi:MAG: hypothetical protein U0667_01790 [Chloroflexota bacterium]